MSFSAKKTICFMISCFLCIVAKIESKIKNVTISDEPLTKRFVTCPLIMNISRLTMRTFIISINLQMLYFCQVYV
jgi:hypothetical protein